MRTLVGLFCRCLCACIAWCALAAEPAPVASWKKYETPVGGSDHILLNNGATVQLNTDTGLRTLVVGSDITVAVDRGEAFFRVGSSPLRVVVDDVSVSGTGTSFSVRDYGGGDVDIMALDGLVHIDSVRTRQATAMLLSNRVARVVSPGQMATVRKGRVSLQDPGRARIERKLMWRYGMLELLDDRIADAAAEFNRYGSVTLVVEDPSIGRRRIGGRFSVSAVAAFVATASRIFPMRIATSKSAAGAVIHLQRGPEVSAANSATGDRNTLATLHGAR